MHLFWFFHVIWKNHVRANKNFAPPWMQNEIEVTSSRGFSSLGSKTHPKQICGRFGLKPPTQHRWEEPNLLQLVWVSGLDTQTTHAAQWGTPHVCAIAALVGGGGIQDAPS